MLDEWPRMAAVVDFGIDDQQHYEALYYPIRNGEIKAEQLEKVLGIGPEITKLVNSCPANPHKGIIFKTAWDDMTDDN